MKNAVHAIIALMVLVAPLTAIAGEEGVPNVKGTWVGDFSIVRSSYPKKAGPNPWAFTKPGFHRAKGVRYVIDKQEGPVFSGSETFGASTQKLVGVIRHDNKSLYFVDKMGFLFGKILSSDAIELVYVENSPHGQVAACGTIRRRQP